MEQFSAINESVKKLAIEVVESTNPVNVVYGKVVSISPLKINIDNKLILGNNQLVLTRNVTDFYTDMTVNHLTENRSGGSGDSAFSSHNHGYVGRKTFLIHNSLIVGDEVLLLRVQGGQKYVVIDRLGG